MLQETIYDVTIANAKMQEGEFCRGTGIDESGNPYWIFDTEDIELEDIQLVW